MELKQAERDRSVAPRNAVGSEPNDPNLRSELDLEDIDTLLEHISLALADGVDQPS
jgi:hypothetical protein